MKKEHNSDWKKNTFQMWAFWFYLLQFEMAHWNYECKKKEFKCDICFKCFGGMDDLQTHISCAHDQNI